MWLRFWLLTLAIVYGRQQQPLCRPIAVMRDFAPEDAKSVQPSFGECFIVSCAALDCCGAWEHSMTAMHTGPSRVDSVQHIASTMQ